MPTIYVAASKELGKWGADVGVSKHVYKLGLTEGSAEEAVAAYRKQLPAGWTYTPLVGDRKPPLDYRRK